MYQAKLGEADMYEIFKIDDVVKELWNTNRLLKDINLEGLENVREQLKEINEIKLEKIVNQIDKTKERIDAIAVGLAIIIKLLLVIGGLLFLNGLIMILK